MSKNKLDVTKRTIYTQTDDALSDAIKFAIKIALFALLGGFFLLVISIMK